MEGETVQQTGTVTKWLAGKGYGFIRDDESKRDLFCHLSDVVDGDALAPGEAVRYDVTESPRGGRACRVMRQ